MSHRLGVYFAPTHGRQSDRDYIAALQPPVIRLLDPDVQQIADMHSLVPDAIVAPRTWVIDDNNGAAVRNLMADPIATGRDHAQQYRAQWDRWRGEAIQRGLKLPTAGRIMFNSANEPNQGGTPDKIAAYNIAFLDRCTELGIRAAALCLGVGWPDNNGPDTPVDWTPYAGIVEPIKRGGHWLCLNEYFYKSGPQDGWRWWAGRHLQCPFNVPILLGEIGCDNYVDEARWRNEGGNRGWVGNVSPDQYAEMIEYHLRNSDARVVAGLPFITDFRDATNWSSFDTAGAHGALLARKDRMIPQGKIAQPPLSPMTPTAVVNVPSGANLRSGPGTNYNIRGAVAAGTPLSVVGKSVHGAWYQVDSQMGLVWVAGSVVALHNVDNVPIVESEPVQPPVPQPSKVPALVHPIADPALRRVTQVFGVNPERYARFGLKGHNGLDFGIPLGTPVRAVADGQATEVRDDPTGYGLYVKLQHRWGQSIYAHLSAHKVVTGAHVAGGEVIGFSGNTGFSTGPHLHLGLRVNPFTRVGGFDGYIDPAPYLAGQPQAGDLLSLIKAAAAEFGHDWQLIAAQAMAESSFNPKAESKAGARGLMQIMPLTWDEFAPQVGAKDIWNPKDNLRVGCAYMAWLKRQLAGYDAPIHMALIAYGWGIGNLLAGKEEPPAPWKSYAARITFGAQLLKGMETVGK